jgi:hypothetical protein
MINGKCFPWFFVFICHHLWHITNMDFEQLSSSKNAITLSLPMNRVKHNSSVVMQCLLHIISASLQCKLQPHHRLSWSAVLLVSAYPIIEDVDCWHSQLLPVHAEQTFVNTLCLLIFCSQELEHCSLF